MIMISSDLVTQSDKASRADSEAANEPAEQESIALKTLNKIADSAPGKEKEELPNEGEALV